MKLQLALVGQNTNQDQISLLNQRLEDICKNVIQLNNTAAHKGLEKNIKNALQDNNNSVIDLAKKYETLLTRYENQNFKPIDNVNNRIEYQEFLRILETLNNKSNEIQNKLMSSITGIEQASMNAIKNVEERLAIENTKNIENQNKFMKSIENGQQRLAIENGQQKLAIEYNNAENSNVLKELNKLDIRISAMNSSLSVLNDSTNNITNNERQNLLKFQVCLTRKVRYSI